MARYTGADTPVETKSEKRVRYFLAVLFFLQSVCTTFPFMHGMVGDEFKTITALQLMIQPDGYEGKGDVLLAIIGALLVLMPVAAFFFCILDSKSRVKYVASGVCAVLSAVLITFSYMFSLGAIITLLLNVMSLFMTMQGVQGTTARMKSQNN